MTDLVARRGTEQAAPAGVPRFPEPRAAAEPAAPPAGVELHRLLALVRLSAAQALEIATAVAEEAARWPVPDPGGPAAGPFPAARVVLGADGRVRTDRAADGGTALGEVLADVAGAAHRRVRDGEPVTDPLLAALDRAVAELPAAGVPAVARRLQEAVAGTDRDGVRAELAALVRAVRGDGPPAPRAAATGPRTARRAAPAPLARGTRTGTVLRRSGAWVLSFLVLAGVVLLEVTTLRAHIAADVRELLDAGRSGSAPPSTPRPDGLPVPSFAPAAAGAVTAVDLRPLTACTPGAPCDLRLLVQLTAAPDQQVVAWSYRVVDRCTSAAYTVPGGSIPVPADGDRAAAVGVVPLPALRSVAVVAVTGLPAAAASAPVVVGSCRSGP
jgi:hypothetical protein